VNGLITSWTVPERIGWIVEREGRDELVAGLKIGFVHLQLDPFSIEPSAILSRTGRSTA